MEHLQSNSNYGDGNSKKSPLENQEKISSLDNPSSKDFFCEKSIKENKRTLSSREVILSFLRMKNWTQVELSQKIGLSPQALNNYLRGFWIFPSSIKIKIAEAFKVDSSVIWDLQK